MFKFISALSYAAFSASVRSSDNMRAAFEESPAEILIRASRRINTSRSSSIIAEPSYTRLGAITGNSYVDERFSRERANERDVIEVARQVERAEGIRRSEAECQSLRAELNGLRTRERTWQTEECTLRNQLRLAEGMAFRLESDFEGLKAELRAEKRDATDRAEIISELQAARAERSERDLSIHRLREELASATSFTEALVSEVHESRRENEKNVELREEMKRSNVRVNSNLEAARTQYFEAARNEQLLKDALEDMRLKQELAKREAATLKAETIELRNEESIALKSLEELRRENDDLCSSFEDAESVFTELLEQYQQKFENASSVLTEGFDACMEARRSWHLNEKLLRGEIGELKSNEEIMAFEIGRFKAEMKQANFKAEMFQDSLKAQKSGHF